MDSCCVLWVPSWVGYCCGDCSGITWWWLAILNAFAPYLFVPLRPYHAHCIHAPSRDDARVVACASRHLYGLFGQQLLPKFTPVAAASVAELKIMTFNIGSDTTRAQPVVKLVLAEEPDLVFLQELRPAQARDLGQALQDRYPYQVLKPLARGLAPDAPMAEEQAS